MNNILISKVETSKTEVKTNEKIEIKVYAFSATENINRRLPFKIGNEKIKV